MHCTDVCSSILAINSSQHFGTRYMGERAARAWTPGPSGIIARRHKLGRGKDLSKALDIRTRDRLLKHGKLDGVTSNLALSAARDSQCKQTETTLAECHHS